jgi:hypothetical protein
MRGAVHPVDSRAEIYRCGKIRPGRAGNRAAVETVELKRKNAHKTERMSMHKLGWNRFLEPLQPKQVRQQLIGGGNCVLIPTVNAN